MEADKAFENMKMRSHLFNSGKANASSTNIAFTTNAGMDHEVRQQSSQKTKVMALWCLHFKAENLDLECTWMQKN